LEGFEVTEAAAIAAATSKTGLVIAALTLVTIIVTLINTVFLFLTHGKVERIEVNTNSRLTILLEQVSGLQKLLMQATGTKTIEAASASAEERHKA
jgi:hypothetical protein